MAKSDSDKDIAELENRVESLEAQLKKMMPGRREVLAGGAAAGAGLLGFGVGQASADGLNDGDTQWGSDSNRDDYVVDHVDANSVSTGGANISERDVLGDDGNRIYVDVSAGDDNNDGSESSPLETIQEAVNRLPYFPVGFNYISVAPGTYNEHVKVPQFVLGGPSDEKSEVGQVIIEGSGANPSDVQVSSFWIQGGQGFASPSIRNFEITGTSPHDNENSGIIGYGGKFGVRNCNFADNGYNGTCIKAYNANCRIDGTIDISAWNNAIEAKGAIIAIGATVQGGCNTFIAGPGEVVRYNASNASGLTTGGTRLGYDGFLIDTNTGDIILGMLHDGAGLVVQDADGSGDRYRIKVDNGSVVADGPL